MVETVGAAGGIARLVGAAFTLIQDVRKARSRIRGSTRPLDDVARSLDTLEGTLGLIKQESSLQTAAVEHQLRCVLDITTELKIFFERLAAAQEKQAASYANPSLIPGDADDRRLHDLYLQVERAKQELTVSISVAQVGMVGSLQDGFRVAFSVLTKTSERVKEVLGTNLTLMELIQNRPVNPTDGTVDITAADLQALHLTHEPSSHKTTAAGAGAGAGGPNETLFVHNVTLGQARIMTGDVGVENWHVSAGRKTTISNNVFGGDVRIMMGNQAGEAGASFNDNFWK